MQNYQQLSVKLVLLSVGLLLSSACTKPNNTFPEREYLDGTIVMKTPINWKDVFMPEAPLNDMHEKKPSILVGPANRRNLLITVRYQPTISINKISTSEVIDLYYKSGESIKLLSVATDSASNKITIDCLGKRYFNPNKVFYLRRVLIIQNGMWASFDFQGIDTKAYRDTVRQMTESIQIHPIKTPARPR